MFVIRVSGGLCNRLRTVCSYCKYVYDLNTSLLVIWTPDISCPGFFCDYFKPIDNVTFIRSNKNNIPVNYYGCSGKKEYQPDYKELQLLPHMIQILKNNIHALQNNYIAVHVRRTDHIVLAKKNNCYTSDKEFLEFIQEHNTIYNVYIATDNKTTYDTFRHHLQEKIILPYHKEMNSLRNTTLKDSIIDLYMCVYATTFKGSGWSSFSSAIQVIRYYIEPLI